MDNIAQLGIKVDSSSIKQATNELSKLTNQSGKTEQSTTNLSGAFSKANIGIAAVGAGLSYLTKQGIAYNATIEKLTNGLTTLNALTSSNVDNFGKQLSVHDKYNIAARESIETIAQLNKINLETPHTLNETVQIYKSMYTSMRSVGVSSEQMIDLTKKLSIAAGSNGIEFQQLLAGIDGLATGTVEASSELGRFLKSMGLGNEVLKNSTNIYETLNNKFKDVKGIIGYEEEISNLENSFDQLTGALVAPFFDDIKRGIHGLSSMFTDLTQSVTIFYDKFKSISELTTTDQLNKRSVEVAERIAEIQKDLSNPSFFQSTGKLNAELRASNLELLSINDQFNKMNKLSEQKTVSTGIDRNESEIIKLAGSELSKFNLQLEDNVNKLKKVGATESEINKFRADQLKEFNDKQKNSIDKQNKSLDEQKKKLEETSKAYMEIAQVGLSDYDNALILIAEKTQKWIEAGVNVNDVLAVQKQLVDELNIQQSLNSASDELSFLERKAQLMTDEYEKSKLLLEIKYAQSMIDIQSSDAPIEQKQMMIDKETELYNLTKERIELDRNTEFQDTIKTFQEDALERQIALNESMYEFGDSFDGIAKQISTASKAIINMNTIAIKGKKEESKLNKKYTKEFSKYANDELKTKELVGQYEKDNSELKQQNQDAEIAGYANLAGAMASAFEKGSAGALAFTTLQATLGIVSSWTAIAQAWALPFPGNIPAVAMVASAVMPIIGQLSAMGGSSGGGSSGGGAKKPSQFEIKEQQIEEMYTPMTDRLDRQIELLESIDKQGSASASNLQGSGITFKRDYELAVNNILKTLPNDVRGYGLNFNQQLAGAESRLGFNIADVNKIKKSGWDSSEKRIYTDFSSLSKDFNLLKVISDYFTTGDGAIAAWFGGASKLNIAANEIQTAIGDFTMGIVSSLDDMKTASNDFKSIYDEITGSMFYENKRLAQAYTDVEKLTKGTSLAEYLKNNIDQIDFLQQTFNNSVLETLLSQDPKDMAEQIKVLEKLQSETGLVFENGAKEALDFMESIKLVGEAMSNTMENRKSLIDNLKDFVDSINSTIDKPTTFKDFSSSFNEMIDAIKLGGDNLEELSNNAINSAQSYLDTIAKNAKSSAEIEFSKKVISNKFEGVINAKDITLGTINDTLKISFNEDSVIVKALNDVKNELVYLNQLNTRQTANSNKTLQLQRASIA